MGNNGPIRTVLEYNTRGLSQDIFNDFKYTVFFDGLKMSVKMVHRKVGDIPERGIEIHASHLDNINVENLDAFCKKYPKIAFGLFDIGLFGEDIRITLDIRNEGEEIVKKALGIKKKYEEISGLKVKRYGEGRPMGIKYKHRLNEKNKEKAREITEEIYETDLEINKLEIKDDKGNVVEVGSRYNMSLRYYAPDEELRELADKIDKVFNKYLNNSII